MLGSKLKILIELGKGFKIKKKIVEFSTKGQTPHTLYTALFKDNKNTMFRPQKQQSHLVFILKTLRGSHAP